jgi:carbon monoxide dehydrogenase subunit G
VTSVEGDQFKGNVKVKLGPIALQYAGTGTFVERDEAARRFVVEAKGKDKRGNGTAAATVTAVMTEEAPDRTSVEVGTDLSITGKPAQFGRGVIQDVSDKLLQQFVDCLESKVGAPSEPAAPEPEAAPAAAAAAATAAAAGEPGATAGPGTGAATDTSGSSEEELGARSVHTADEPRSTAASGQEALDLGATVLPVLLRTYWRQLAGAAAVVLVLRWLTGRRRR